MTKNRWAGRPVTQARASWLRRLPVQCCRCGKPVVHDPGKKQGGWQVDHWPVPRELGGTATWPAHTFCNLSAGGKRGAAITNSRRAVVIQRMESEQSRGIRGI